LRRQKDIFIDMKKYTGEILLTKEAFALYTQQLREETAKQHGLTLEEWDAAILNQDVVQQMHNHISGSME
jgi:hypothetical protein